ncbi:MAG: hypothetical protein RL745_732 [Actinomycetota bacterium]
MAAVRTSAAALAALADAEPSVMWHDGATWSRYLGVDDIPSRADVVILGGGYTGLWTALWLKELQPTFDVVVLEAEHIGFGASSRNGGWVSALLPASGEKLAQMAGGGEAGRQRAKEAMAFLRQTVQDFEESLTHFGIDADYQRRGTFMAARSPLHEKRAHEDVAYARTWGAADADMQWAPVFTAMNIARMDQLLGGTFTPHCASIQPAKLVTGLAAAAAARGVRIIEGVAAVSADNGRVSAVARGGNAQQQTVEIEAEVVVRALEAYTPSLSGHERAFAPVYSLMLATEPLPAETLDSIALASGMTFADYRHLIIYGQRTADNRIAFGGRGAPYHFGSAVDSKFEQNRTVHTALFDILCEMFPQLSEVKITHTWGGALAVPRDWTPSMGYDQSRRFAYSGGYLGDGVTMSYVGGRTLAELICGHHSQRTTMPWVGHRSRAWEREPWRWLGIQSGLRAMTWADAIEQRTGRTSHVAQAINRALGKH